VLVIVLDTVRPDHLGLYGYERATTPVLDAFAEDCLVFQEAWSTASWTVPAHASLFTGTYPAEHWAHNVEEDLGGIGPNPTRPLDDSLPTLAELLGAAGYRTGAVVGNFIYAGRKWGFARGFARFDDRCRLHPFRDATLLEFVRARWLPELEPHLYDRVYVSAGEVVERACGWLRDGGTQPFMLFLNFIDAHDPYAPPRRFVHAFGAQRDVMMQPRDEVISGERSLRPAERAELIDLYDAEIRSCDAALGELFAFLHKEGLFDDTLIVVTADHGEAFEEHRGFVAHGFTLYAEETRIPLLVKYPASRVVGKSDRTVQIVDVLPTILDEVGLPVPRDVQGRDLQNPPDRAFMELYSSEADIERFGERMDYDLKAAVLTEPRIKVIFSSAAPPQLYLLEQDPHELVDRAARFPGLVARARTLTDSTLTASALDDQVLDDETAVDEDLREQLRSLGYVQ
jgi:arylsulfatase A-like enzyme